MVLALELRFMVQSDFIFTCSVWESSLHSSSCECPVVPVEINLYRGLCFLPPSSLLFCLCHSFGVLAPTYQCGLISELVLHSLSSACGSFQAGLALFHSFQGIFLVVPTPMVRVLPGASLPLPKEPAQVLPGLSAAPSRVTLCIPGSSGSWPTTPY
jgi:hypothetical protein